MVYQLPVKSKKLKVSNRYLSYVVFRSAGDVLINQRSQKGIWAGLFEFPGIEGKEPQSLTEVKNHFNLVPESKINEVTTIIHKLTHLRLEIKVYSLDQIPSSLKEEKYQLHKVKELHNFAFPKPLKSLIESKTLFK